MLKIIYLTILVINILFVCIKKSPKFLLAFDYLFTLFLFATTTTTTNDYAYYELMYYRGTNRTSYEYLFNILMDLIQHVGLDFMQFMGILWIIFGTIILYVFSRYSKNFALFFSLYYIHLLFLEIVQLKNFCACALLLVGLLLFIQGRRLSGAILIGVAALFHVEMIFFLPLCLFDADRGFSLKFIKRAAIIVIAICVGMFVLGQRTSVITNVGYYIILLIAGESKTVYFETQTRFGFLLYFGLHVAAMATTYYARVCSNEFKDIDKSSVTAFLDKCLMIQFYSIFALPFLMVNMNFYRLLRALNYLNFMAWAVTLDGFKETTTKYYKMLALIFGSTALYRIPLVHGNNQIDVILSNNAYFK